MSWTDIWNVIERTSAVVALFGVPYLIIEKRRHLPRFSFDFSGQEGQGFKKDSHNYYKFTFTGTVINHSLDTSTILRFYLVVWDDKKKVSTLRFGFGAHSIDDNSGTLYKEPVLFSPKESKKLTVVFESIIDGTQDEKLLSEIEPVFENSNVYLPKHRYELVFEDSDHNFFDQNGNIITKKLIDLNWTLENTFKDLKKGNSWPYRKHKLKIKKAMWGLKAKRFVRKLGF
jgi:hypothetical protein